MPLTTHTKGIKKSCGNCHTAENSRKAYHCVSTVSTCQLLTMFTCILNHKNNKNEILTTAGWRRMSGEMLSFWTVHHLDRWIKIDQLDITCFIISQFTAQHCFEYSYIHLQELATYCGIISCVVLLWFDVCWCYDVVRLGWSGILMQAEALLQSA